MQNLKQSNASRTEIGKISRRGMFLALAAALPAVPALAQSANDYESAEVNAIAVQLLCDCGCNLDMACVMPPSGVCEICRGNKVRIAAMLKEGLTEQQILDFYVSEKGPEVLAVRPGAAGFATPFIALVGGLGAVLLTIKYYMGIKPAPAVAPANDADLARFQDQIDQDLEKLD